MNEIHNVCVYCASSTQIDESYNQAARELGALLAQNHIQMVYGAGVRGLMGVIADAVLAHGGRVTGVIPSFMVEKGWHHPGITHTIEVPSMAERKKLMEALGDATIALPGGVGTFDELMEVMSLKKLSLYRKPVVMLNTNGFYDPLIALLQRSVDEHFMSASHLSMWGVARTPQEVIDLVYGMPAIDPSFIDNAVI